MNECLICNHNTEPVLDFGVHGLPYFTDTPTEIVPTAPLAVDYCPNCFALQQRECVDPKLLFTKYGYRSGINATMRNYLITLAREVTQIADLQADSITLDIGSNDGTLLDAFKVGKKVGFEPSNAADDMTRGEAVIFREFFSAEPFRAAFGKQKAQAVTSVAMFYDVQWPTVFARRVAEILAARGVWCLEMNYLASMLRDNAFDFIVHEHVCLYFLETLNRAIRPAGLEVFHVSENSSNGGSLRAYIGHMGQRQIAPSVGAMLAAEAPLQTLKSVQAFAKRVETIQTTLRERLDTAYAKGESVYGYGASTRGSTTLQAIGANPLLVQAIADRNPKKVGKFMGRTRIPIISEAQMRKAKPDYLLVLPWAFLPEFQKREEAYLAAGGKFIVPLPEPRVIG